MQYVFPAVFTKEDAGYSVSFPDVDNCFTSGETMAEALAMAEDALSLILMVMEDDGDPIPTPSDINAIHHADNEVVSLIRADTVEYRKLYGRQAVKKTLSIPAWLNTLAEKNDVNFSATLQKALKEVLDIA